MDTFNDVVIRKRGLSKQTLTQSVCDELHAIAKACNYHLTPDVVLRNAAKPESPIHDCFEWDDSQAAERFRYIQAAMLIRSVKVSVETHPQDKPKIVRAFVSVAETQESHDDGKEQETDPTQKTNFYVPLEVALKTDDYRSQMLDNAYRELRSFQRKYSVLKELTSVFDEIEKLAIPV